MFVIYLVGSFIAMLAGTKALAGTHYFESKNALVVFNNVAAFTWPIGLAVVIGGWVWDRLNKKR